MSSAIDVEVACGTPARQRLLRVRLESGTTAREAAVRSKIGDDIEGIDPSRCALGVWGRPVGDDHVLIHGDRLELYRPLQMDPREARRALARQGLSMGASSVARRSRRQAD